MSENVENLRAGFEAWNAGDMEALRQLFHPEAHKKVDELVGEVGVR